MTDAEIIKAKAHFEYGIKCDIFKEPVLSYAKTVLEAFDEINRQKAEIESLDFLIKESNKIAERQDKEIERLKERDETAEKIIREQGGTILDLKHENSRLFDRNLELSEKGEKTVIACIAAKNEAIKEFAERLKAECRQDRYAIQTSTKFGVVDKKYLRVVDESDIDNLLKEMVGEG